ncbi:MAG: tetratricopeptide repeat protein [Muribaculaceae bacterium]|nr:tetratricopeptide repeat protein [Muribaculaceae bacterium]
MKARVIIIICILAALLQACSLKKNTAASRQYTAFITRYNIYFNGDQHYTETLKDMESKYEDDYSRMLFVHPAEAHADPKAPQPSGDFTRSIEKAQKAIQLRSIKKRPARKAGKSRDPEYKAWLKREEYNPFLHNAWMMMGRSQFMNGDFLGAASTFFYISKHFSWLPATVTEAKLWQAQSYCAEGWLFEAEGILSRIKESELTSGTLKGLYATASADLYVRSHEYDKAVPMLIEAARHAGGAQRGRLYFLLGQVYQALGQKKQAYEAFGKAGGGGASYRAKFNARIKQSEVFDGSNIEPEVKALRSMAKYGRNSEYLDQIYYAIANLYLSRGDTARAMDNYRLAVEKSTRAGIDKALAQITLGGLYYEQGDYDKAQPCYAEALPLIPDTYPDYSTLRRRSDVLDELAVYSQNVTLQDSLLKLSYLDRTGQLEVVNRIIADLKAREKKEAEDAAREEYLARQSAQGNGLQQLSGSTSNPATFTMNTDNSWYFYNPSTRNAGRTDFQRRWGSRKLEDDWRRRNKNTYSFDAAADSEDSDGSLADNDNDNPSDSLDATGRNATSNESDPHHPDYYLRQIPANDAERTVSREVIQDGLYNMGVILKDKMRDYPASDKMFERLLSEYPDNVYRLDVYNNLYLMYLIRHMPDMAERYRQLILSDFPESKYAEALRDPHHAEKLLSMDSIQNVLYDRAYAAYMDNDNASVHRIAAEMRRDYPLSRIMPKFMFIDALAYVTERNPDKFASTLQELLERYPDVDVSPLASDYLRQLKQGRKLNSSEGNVRGLVWSTRLTADSATVSMADEPADFDLDSINGPHLLVLLYPTDRVDSRQLLFDIAHFNFNSFTVRDYDLEQMNFGTLGMLIVSGFRSADDVARYRRMLEGTDMFSLPPDVIPVAISRKNFDILLSQGRSFEEYFDAVGDDRLRRTHTQVLPPDEYPTAEEMYHPEPEDTPAREPEKKPDHDNPAPPPAPVPSTPKPATPSEPEPDIPEGSEGDDPLLD